MFPIDRQGIGENSLKNATVLFSSRTELNEVFDTFGVEQAADSPPPPGQHAASPNVPPARPPPPPISSAFDLTEEVSVSSAPAFGYEVRNHLIVKELFKGNCEIQ